MERSESHLIPETRSHFSRFCVSAFDFLIPPVCCCCHGVVLETTGQIGEPGICQSCRQLIPAPLLNTCQICGSPVGPHSQTAQGCHYCRKDRLRFSGAVSLGVYTGEFARLCHSCKSPVQQVLVSWLTRQLWNRHQPQLEDWNCDFIVPVPMSLGQRLFRRVHPSETIAEELAQLLKRPVLRKVLGKRHRWSKQSWLSPTERRKAVRKSYFCKRTRNLEAKSILLVDDILTTGATASECAHQLLLRGAKSVHVAALARGVGK